MLIPGPDAPDIELVDVGDGYFVATVPTDDGPVRCVHYAPDQAMSCWPLG